MVVVSRRNNGSIQEFALGDYPANDSTTLNTRTAIKRRPRLSGLRRINYWIQSTFLPVGYPATVKPRYIEFSVWSALQDWSTSLRMTLATQRVLEGVGVGQSTATAVSAVQNFLVRDAAGMLATLLFTASTQFAANVKRWRIFADILVDIGITLEVAAIQVPKQYFLLMLCLGNICKAICGVAAGATGVPLIQYWGKDTADVSAKAGAQRTVVGGIGLLVSAMFARWSSTAKLSQVWILYAALTAFHIFANIQCMKTVAFPYFNVDRLESVAGMYLDAWSLGNQTELPSVSEIGRKESLYFLPQRRRIRFGVSFNSLVEEGHVNPHQCRDLLKHYGYCCVATKKQHTVVALAANIDPFVKTKAYFHAMLLQRVLDKVPAGQCALAEQIALQEIDGSWNGFVRAAHGWDLHQSNLNTLGYDVWTGQSTNAVEQ